MVRRSVALLVLAAALLAAALMLRPQPLPQDIALPAPLPEGPLRLTVFGTSLSAAPQIWPDALAARLSACRGAPVTVERVAGPGRGSDWALGQVERVAATLPDLVLVEFAINDADLRDGVWPAQGRAQHEALIAALGTALERVRPDAQLALMTMSPAQGPRGWVRPGLARHYGQYHSLARSAGTGLIDLYPRWLQAPRAARGLQQDGLHPAPEAASAIILPGVLAALGVDCPPAP